MIDWEETVRECIEHDEDPHSHRELDPYTFHPSQLGNCKRQCYLSKLDLTENTMPNKCILKLGTIIHEWLEETAPQIHSNVVMEQPIEHDLFGLTIVGHSDCVEYADEGTFIHDFKTRGDGWYHFDPPIDYHITQVQVYMDALDADGGKIVYLDRNKLVNHDPDDKTDWWIEEWPREGYFEPDQSVLDDVIKKGHEIGSTIAEEGLPESPDDIPFPKCGCWLCGIETLDEDAFF